jgi:hypothetical protein
MIPELLLRIEDRFRWLNHSSCQFKLAVALTVVLRSGVLES